MEITKWRRFFRLLGMLILAMIAGVMLMGCHIIIPVGGGILLGGVIGEQNGNGTIGAIIGGIIGIVILVIISSWGSWADRKKAKEKERKELSLKESVMDDNPKAQFDLGVFYMDGYRWSEAKEWFEKALKQGYTEAEAKLKECNLRLEEKARDVARKAEEDARKAEEDAKKKKTTGRNVYGAEVFKYTRGREVHCNECINFLGHGCSEQPGVRISPYSDACASGFISKFNKCGGCKYFNGAKGECESIRSATLSDTAACNRYSE